MKKNTIIVGAGLVGSLLSIYLSKRGYNVKIFERRPDMRKEQMSAGRSINLALSDRGIKALEEVGIMDDIKKISIPMHGRFFAQCRWIYRLSALWPGRTVYQFCFERRAEQKTDGSGRTKWC